MATWKLVALTGAAWLPELLADVDGSLALALPVLIKLVAKKDGWLNAWASNSDLFSWMLCRALRVLACDFVALSYWTPSTD